MPSPVVSPCPASTAGPPQLWPCVCCNGLYICRVSYFNHSRDRGNWGFKDEVQNWKVTITSARGSTFKYTGPRGRFGWAFAPRLNDFSAEVTVGTHQWRKCVIKNPKSINQSITGIINEPLMMQLTVIRLICDR